MTPIQFSEIQNQIQNNKSQRVINPITIDTCKVLSSRLAIVVTCRVDGSQSTA